MIFFDHIEDTKFWCPLKMKFYVVIYDAFIISFIFDIFCLYTFSPRIFYCFKIRILIFSRSSFLIWIPYTLLNIFVLFLFSFIYFLSSLFFNVLFFYQQFFSIVAQFCFLKTFPKLFYLLPEFFYFIFYFLFSGISLLFSLRIFIY